MKKRTIILCILVLTACDLITKAIIAANWLNVTFDIIPGIIEFRPKFNTDYSYVNQLLDLGMGFWITIILTLLAAVLFFLLYRLLRYYSKHKKLLDFSLIFIFAAVSSSLTSHIIGKGVLDYIYLRPLFIFDLKDMYVWTGIALLYIATIKDMNAGITIKWQDIKNRLRR